MTKVGTWRRGTFIAAMSRMNVQSDTQTQLATRVELKQQRTGINAMRRVVPTKLKTARLEGYGYPKSALAGAFQLMGPCGTSLRIISNGAEHPDAHGWEHVSVSTERRCPNWEEMCFIKDLFWEENELVIQYHVPKEDHINNHPYVLHLWKDTHFPHPRMPPANQVGIKGLSHEESRKLGRRMYRKET